MKLDFITVTGSEFDIETQPRETVGQLKKRMAEDYKIQPENIRFILSNYDLPDSEKIESLNIIPGTKIVFYKTNQFVTRERPIIDFDVSAISQIPPTSKVRHSSRVNKRESDSPNYEFLAPLMELGFNALTCEKALRSANYNIEDAANLILSNVVEIVNESDNNQHSNANNFSDPLECPDEEISSKEKACIRRLMQTGIDLSVVLAMFFSCDRDEQATLMTLRSIQEDNF
ncbi:hypothetical protein TRFO_18215 [Tritrichomonas foetus]|uniref:UV excision repair protein RAD23 n=1 Tax=Tritrichomonas foetus TaxID=1144522 RepID=A0A1J4KQT2_9EUKA|nr:hypothetical protein TRFO_18215 [Tritrichomonas foetus]|eukprot:OHT12030.1 hypothetical protein TRFO_18215 [Tritrichomonas foetus]